MAKWRVWMIVVLALLGVNRADASTEPCFTPGANCAAVFLREIGTARKTIRVQAYSFTSVEIANALIAAKNRGVDVEVLLDKKENMQKEHSVIAILVSGGVTTKIDGKHHKAHSKVMIFDGATVITGSFNFSKSASTKNAENVLLIRDDSGTTDQFSKEWTKHQLHSKDAAP